MLITQKVLEDRFNEYNRLYFGGRLNMPDLGFHKSFKDYGRFSCNLHSVGSKLKNAKITVSSYYNFTEDQLRDVLVHEMLHYKIERNRDRGDDPHGDRFIEESARLNEKYGLNITVNPVFDDIEINENAPRFSLMRFIFG